MDTAELAAPDGLDARIHAPHPLHAQGCDWPEKNCYADLWIGTLHALGLEPLAMLGHTVAVDFEGDQWTFFKPCRSELRDLYGIDLQEMTVWRPLQEHVVEHLAAGKFVCTEADAWWLPDTAATDYRRKHTKTTILIDAIDPRARRLAYFHNAGHFELEGEDYDEVLRDGVLPLFAELVRIDRVVRHPPDELARRALRWLRTHHEGRPATNPFERFGERFAHDLPALREAGLDRYHAWAFAATRQAGAAFELAAAHLRWLAPFAGDGFAAAAQPFAAISSANKSLILKGARAAATGKSFEPRDATSAMAQAWTQGMALLDEALARADTPKGR
jgi:hypothetical protein